MRPVCCPRHTHTHTCCRRLADPDCNTEPVLTAGTRQGHVHTAMHRGRARINVGCKASLFKGSPSGAHRRAPCFTFERFRAWTPAGPGSSPCGQQPPPLTSTPRCCPCRTRRCTPAAAGCVLQGWLTGGPPAPPAAPQLLLQRWQRASSCTWQHPSGVAWTA